MNAAYFIRVLTLAYVIDVPGEAHAEDPNVLVPTLYGRQFFNEKVV
jgi:hypothetical protein